MINTSLKYHHQCGMFFYVFFLSFRAAWTFSELLQKSDTILICSDGNRKVNVIIEWRHWVCDQKKHLMVFGVQCSWKEVCDGWFLPCDAWGFLIKVVYLEK